MRPRQVLPAKDDGAGIPVRPNDHDQPRLPPLRVARLLNRPALRRYGVACSIDGSLQGIILPRRTK
jgi:hypothetical protein